MNYYKTIILGAGASGLMLASKLQKDVCIIEANEKFGAKIKISGGGKCNITNMSVSTDNFYGDKKLVQSALDIFSSSDLLDYFSSRGLKYNIEKPKYFCAPNSLALLEIFTKDTKKIHKFFNTKVEDVEKEDDKFVVITNNGKFYCTNLVVATGSLSFARLGASDMGHKIATKFGHKITVLKPALVGLTLQKDQAWMKELSGVSMLVNAKVGVKEFKQKMLLAHKGISGPAILNVSLYWDKGNIEIDFLPDMSKKALLSNKSNKQISTVLPLAKNFIKSFLNQIGLEDKAISRLSIDEQDKLLLFKNYCFAPAGNFGYTKAEVTRGGVVTEELDENLMSKYEKNLFFMGEVVDITGELGGYNIQWAFSSSRLVARQLM